MVDIDVAYEGGLRCRTEHAGSRAVVLTDAPADNHGSGNGFSPTDLLWVSLGSCILSVMGIAVQSMDMEISGATATVSKEMANSPRRIARISVTVRVKGSFDNRQRRALEAAAHACAVNVALAIKTPITIEWLG